MHAFELIRDFRTPLLSPYLTLSQLHVRLIEKQLFFKPFLINCMQVVSVFRHRYSNNRTSMRLLSLKIIAPLAALALASMANAAQITLLSGTATLSAGNTTSLFYEFNGSTESGSATGSFSAAYSGPAGNQNTVTFTQSVAGDINLSSAFIKAGPSYIQWDATDLAAWNLLTSTIGDQLVLVNTVITNDQGIPLGTSHAGLVGGAPGGGGATGVPDGGTTVTMLGLVLGLLAFAKRKFGV